MISHQARMVFALSTVLALQSAVAAAPRCLSSQYPGVIKNQGEFVITLTPAPGGPRDPSQVTAILNEADAEDSTLVWKYAYDGKGNAYISAKFKTWAWDSAHDTEASFHQRYDTAVARAYAALDKVAALPGVTVKCDAFTELDHPIRDAATALQWVKPGGLYHHLSAPAAEQLIQLFLTNGFRNPLQPKKVWYDVRHVLCKTPHGKEVAENWTCVVDPYGAHFKTLEGEQAARLARLLFDARAETYDVGSLRTLDVSGLMCSATVVQPGPSTLSEASCHFDAR